MERLFSALKIAIKTLSIFSCSLVQITYTNCVTAVVNDVISEGQQTLAADDFRAEIIEVNVLVQCAIMQRNRNTHTHTHFVRVCVGVLKRDVGQY